jgi:hypothetical protein
MKTRYNWDEFPEWANYATTDADGDLFVWSHKPKIGFAGWRFAIGSFWFIKKCDADENWRDSLEQRPSLDDTRESIIAIIKTVLQQIEVDAENYGEEIACSIIAERSADMILERLGLKNQTPCE